MDKPRLEFWLWHAADPPGAAALEVAILVVGD